MADGEPEVLLPPEESRLATTHAKFRAGVDGRASRTPSCARCNYAEALF